MIALRLVLATRTGALSATIRCSTMLRITIYATLIVILATGPLPLRRMLRRIHKASVDMVLCAPNKKRKATEKLIAPTNQRLKGFRMQKKIRGPIPSQLHQRRPKTNDNECLLLAASPWSVEETDACLLSKQRTGARLCRFRR